MVKLSIFDYLDQETAKQLRNSLEKQCVQCITAIQESLQLINMLPLLQQLRMNQKRAFTFQNKITVIQVHEQYYRAGSPAY